MVKKKNMRELMDESLLYERIIGQLTPLVTEMRLKHNVEYKLAKNENRKVDYCYKMSMDILQSVVDVCRKYSNELWKAAENGSEEYEDRIQNLANAVILRSIYDYEDLVSRGANGTADYSVNEILSFWNDEAAGLTSLDMSSIKERINEASKEFKKVVTDNGEKIAKETSRGRKSGKNLENYLSVKCPMCGGKLFAYGKPVNGLQTINCTGCNLSATYYNKTKKESA